MRFVEVILTALLFFPLHVHGITKRDTIYTTDGDRIILTYEITNAANQTTIRFTGQQKKLGKLNAKYTDLSKVAVMFFDRTGNYNSDISITNMVPEAFMIPSEVQYQNRKKDSILCKQNQTCLLQSKLIRKSIFQFIWHINPKEGNTYCLVKVWI